MLSDAADSFQQRRNVTRHFAVPASRQQCHDA
jgi:hypothetical protein